MAPALATVYSSLRSNPFVRFLVHAYVRLTLQDPTVTARESWDFWRSKGAPPHVGWACLGNEMRETSFNWKAPGDKNAQGVYTAHGICQWHEARRQEILEGCKIDVNTADHPDQLAAMFWELEKTGLWKKLLNSIDVYQACDLLVRDFERPKLTDRDVKLQVGFANELRSKHPDWEKDATPAPAPAVHVAPSAASPIIANAQPKTITAYLKQAGRFPVVQIPCPHFSTPVSLTAPRAGVLHTVEGGWDGGMAVFHAHFAPQFIVGFNAHYTAAKRLGQPFPAPPSGGVEIAQLVPVGTIGAALVTHDDLAIVQIEVVAFSKEEPWIFDDATLEAVAALMATCETEYGIPLSRPWPDGTWGRAGSTPHRNDGHFGKTAGWFGHGDVPSPDTHWDPGNLEWSKLFDRAKALNNPEVA